MIRASYQITVPSAAEVTLTLQMPVAEAGALEKALGDLNSADPQIAELAAALAALRADATQVFQIVQG